MANRTLAFEIGTEELPAFALHNATEQLPGLAKAAFEAARIPFESMEAYSTPRRIILMAHGVAEQTPASEEVFRGPSAKIAFDSEGNPTKACQGFARGKGVEVSDLERRDENGTEYVYAIKHLEACDVAALLKGVLENLIVSIDWPKSQRWGNREEQFSRPVRWLLAMFGTEVIDVEFAGLHASDTTRGHRFMSPGPHAVADADLLLDVLRSEYVIPSEAEREARIRQQVSEAEMLTGLVAELPAKTMAEVVNLTEYPTVMVGEFDELFLAVPKEITVDAMLVHQRYFPLFNADGSLSNHFLITSNGDPKFEDNIVDGNQRVVAARLYDAKFFYDEDLKQPLEAYVEKLDTVVFQEKLGTTRAKTDRIVSLAAELADDAQVGEDEKTDALRAAFLSKADLVTGAVVEFTSVQGVMGSYYAEASGETPAVCRAIAEHYRPRFAGDELPSETVGQIVAFADKLDTICGLFAIDQGPTGSSDPFALRRSAIGIVGMLNAGLPVSLEAAIDCALASYAKDGLEFDEVAVKDAVIDFFVTRTKVILKDAGHAVDAIDAVVSCGVTEPAVIAERVSAIEEARNENSEAVDDLAVAYARANNLRDASLGLEVDDSLMGEEERVLADAVSSAESSMAAALRSGDYPAALAELASLRGPIDAFFDSVMVMDDDMRIKENRLRLLNRFVEVFSHVADFGKLAK